LNPEERRLHPKLFLYLEKIVVSFICVFYTICI